MLSEIIYYNGLTLLWPSWMDARETHAKASCAERLGVGLVEVQNTPAQERDEVLGVAQAASSPGCRY